jgi:hypothetical protein
MFSAPATARATYKTLPDTTDAMGEVKDFVLGLLELYRQHSGVNITGVVAAMLTNFEAALYVIMRLTTTLLSPTSQICTALRHQSDDCAVVVTFLTLELKSLSGERLERQPSQI